MALEASKFVLRAVGAYDIVEKIAEGGMGTVYKGRHKASGQTVAIKVVSPNMTNNQVLLKRFENEFRAASKLNHPNVVRAYDVLLRRNDIFLVLEYVEGCDLAQLVGQFGPLPVADAADYALQAARALAYAHRLNVVHRDIKPANILIRRPDPNLRGSSLSVRLTDFNVAKLHDQDVNFAMTQMKSVPGTLFERVIP